MKESYYHGLLLGMLMARPGWIVKSEREAGNGRADIIMIDSIKGIGIIIEVKYATKLSMLDIKAKEALSQINDLKYEEYFLGYDIGKILKYGIAFYNKNCRVVK